MTARQFQGEEGELDYTKSNERRSQGEEATVSTDLKDIVRLRGEVVLMKDNAFGEHEMLDESLVQLLPVKSLRIGTELRMLTGREHR